MTFKKQFYLIIYLVWVLEIKPMAGECRDLNGRAISQGMHFVPGPDSCTLCICDNGTAKWCKAVLCSPPQYCKSFRVGNSCCEFICLDDTLNRGDGTGDNGADLGLRLIASAVIVGLSLSLIFVLVLRLRQRKIRVRQNRQLSEDQRSLASIGYITGSLGYLPQSYLGGHGPPDHIEFHYEEPPSHYPLWKPAGNYYARDEAPPPYEEAISQTRNQVTISSNNTLINMAHRTIPVNLATSGTIRILDPSNTISITPAQNGRLEPDNIMQCLDANTICIVDNSTGRVRSELNSNSLRKNMNIVRSRNTVSLPRSRDDEKRKSAVVVNLPPEANPSAFRCEININADTLKPHSGETSRVASSVKRERLTVQDIPPPIPDELLEAGQAIRSDAYYDNVFIGLPEVLNTEENPMDSSKQNSVDDNDPPSSCDCSSYQCLTNDDNDDYRSECENCKSGPGSNFFLDEDLEPPETMTLQRVPKELDEFENQDQYYRTSLTLPTNCKRPKSTPLQSISSARENWFSSMPETGSSSEEE